jgi:hypothetical protein
MGELRDRCYGPAEGTAGEGEPGSDRSPGRVALPAEGGCGRQQAGLEVVEKLLTSSIYPANKTGSAPSSRRAIVAP